MAGPCGHLLYPLCQCAAQPRERADGWTSAITAIGDPNVDKRLTHQHAACNLSYLEISRLWETDDMTAKAIEAPGAECFREGYDISISDEGKYQDLKESIEEKLLELGVDAAIEKALRYRRAYGGAAILLGVDDGRKLSEPLDIKRVRSIYFLNVFEPLELVPASLYDDPFHPKYGEPEYFQLNTIGGISPIATVPGIKPHKSPPSGPVYIHESRLLIFQGIKTSRYYFSNNRDVSEFWGAGIIPRFIEALRDCGVAYAGAGLLATDVSQPVISIQGLKEMVAKNEKALVARWRALERGRSIARAIVLDADKEKFERQTTQLAGIPDLLDRLSQRLAAAVGIPLSILFGYSPATLGSPDNQELQQWHNFIRAMQRREITPALRRIIDISVRTMRQRKIPKKYEIEWVDLEHLSTLQLAEARLTQARTDSLEVKSGTLYPDEIRKSRHGGKYSFDTQINESKKAPGFIAPLPAGVLPGAMPAGGVVSAFEAKGLGGAAGANANAHNVGGYTRRNPTAPALGANPKVGGDVTPTGKRDEDGPGQPVDFAGLPVVIENPKGSVRQWTDTDGTCGETTMKYDYGYIANTVAPDGDSVDVYLGPNASAQWVYVVHQMSKASNFESFDEDKVMLGFDSANHARDAYLRQYNDERFFGGMSQMTMDDFRRQLATSAMGRITHATMDELELDLADKLERIEQRLAQIESRK